MIRIDERVINELNELEDNLYTKLRSNLNSEQLEIFDDYQAVNAFLHEIQLKNKEVQILC